MTHDHSHEDAQHFEADWWGDCTNTYGEETKQITYAHRMGIPISEHKGWWPVYNIRNARILDIGGGPTSILLKCINRGDPCVVVDPCPYPLWTASRYFVAGIGVFQLPGEKFEAEPGLFDEVWIYNVLQHVEDPELIIRNAKAAAPVIRIFEWINIPAYRGHPQMLLPADLDKWLGGKGKIETMNENGCQGTAYYGRFLVDNNRSN